MAALDLVLITRIQRAFSSDATYGRLRRAEVMNTPTRAWRACRKSEFARDFIPGELALRASANVVIAAAGNVLFQWLLTNFDAGLSGFRSM